MQARLQSLDLCTRGHLCGRTAMHSLALLNQSNFHRLDGFQQSCFLSPCKACLKIGTTCAPYASYPFSSFLAESRSPAKQVKAPQAPIFPNGQLQKSNVPAGHQLTDSGHLSCKKSEIYELYEFGPELCSVCIGNAYWILGQFKGQFKDTYANHPRAL